MEETKKDKPSKLFVVRDYIVLGLFVLAVLFYKDTDSDVINYPTYLIYLVGIAIGTAIVILRFRKFEEKYIGMQKPADRLFYAMLCLLVTTIGSWTIASMALIPFNYYNVYAAKKNIADTLHCNIDSTVVGHRTSDEMVPNTIYYHTESRQNIITSMGQTGLIANMRAMHIENQFELKLTVHKALLGSYWLEQWQIEKKPVIHAVKPK